MGRSHVSRRAGCDGSSPGGGDSPVREFGRAKDITRVLSADRAAFSRKLWALLPLALRRRMIHHSAKQAAASSGTPIAAVRADGSTFIVTNAVFIGKQPVRPAPYRAVIAARILPGVAWALPATVSHDPPTLPPPASLSAARKAASSALLW